MQNARNKKQKREKKLEVISDYRTRYSSLRNLPKNENPCEIEDAIAEHLEGANINHRIIRKDLDGTAADSRLVREVAALAKESSKKININREPVEIFRVIRTLWRSKGRLTQTEFCRYVTENLVSSVLCSAPTFEFFYGALKAENLERKERKARVRERLVESQATLARERNIETDVEQDSTPQEVEHIEKEIDRLAKDKPDGVPFFKTIVDPESFTQTVENIFHISFLVKEGKLGIKSNPRGAVITVDRSESAGSQSILSFSIDDYKQWLSTFNIDRRAF